MAEQIEIDEAAIAYDVEADKLRGDGTHEVADDLAYKRLVMVNTVFWGIPGQSGWVLIDAGIPGSGSALISAAEERFGELNPPAGIVLTHGHFDHVGALKSVIEKWGCPVFAHPLEAPYLDGTLAYPPPDPGADAGLMAKLSPLYPRDPIDVSQHLVLLPEDKSIPIMPGWRWVHTPGHSDGHISLFRETDRMLISGDAVITTNTESALASLITQEPEVHGPPNYFTSDWIAARQSVEQLAYLQPETIVSGHGPAMHGAEMRMALSELADRFDEVARPASAASV